MALIRISKFDTDEASELRDKLDVATRALQKRSAPLVRRKDKIDRELEKLRSGSEDGSVVVLSRSSY